MSTKIEKIYSLKVFPENDAEKEMIERWELLKMYLPARFRKLTGYEFDALPKEDKLKYGRFLHGPMGKPRARDDKQKFHRDLKRMLKCLEQMTTKEQIDHYTEKIKEISEAFRIFGITKVLEIEDSEIEVIIEEFRLTKQIFEEKLKALEELKFPAPIENIFQSEKFPICYKLLVNMEIIDSITGECLLTPRKGYLLFSAIAAIKHYSRMLLKNYNYSYPFLLQVFNQFLKTNYVEVKTNSPGFKEYSKKAKEYLSALL